MKFFLSKKLVDSKAVKLENSFFPEVRNKAHSKPLVYQPLRKIGATQSESC
jgi:hypothetical protein